MDISDIFDQLKKGVMTSEFWLGLLTAVWVVLKTAIDPAKSWGQNFAVVAPLAGAAVYAFCRTWLKRKRVELVSQVVSVAPPVVAPPAPPMNEVP